MGEGLNIFGRRVGGCWLFVDFDVNIFGRM